MFSRKRKNKKKVFFVVFCEGGLGLYDWEPQWRGEGGCHIREGEIRERGKGTEREEKRRPGPTPASLSHPPPFDPAR